MGNTTIVRVRVRELGYLRAGNEQPKTSTQGEYWLSTPTTRFPDARSNARGYFGPATNAVVEIETADGIVGIGTAGSANVALAPLIVQHLAPLIIGEDAFQVERIWDRLYRSTIRFGMRGIAIAAISGIDIALWDIKGRALGVPVVDLLGGRHHQSIPAYASRLYAMKDLDQLAAEAKSYKEAGFKLVKQRFGFGPQDGERGIRMNKELVRTVKEAVGDDVAVAGDAYMSWDVEYALRMERELREFDMAWIEEPLMPHDIPGYARLCAAAHIPIAHGEHSYTKWDFAQLIRNQAVHILQPDVNRTGGITEAQKVWALAEAHDLPVIPHSNEMHNLHLSFSKPNSPWSEYFPYRSDDKGMMNTIFYEIFSGNPVAKDGRLELPDTPGIGLEIVEDEIAQLVRSSATVEADA